MVTRQHAKVARGIWALDSNWTYFSHPVMVKDAGARPELFDRGSCRVDAASGLAGNDDGPDFRVVQIDLFFERDIASLSPFQAARLALAVAELRSIIGNITLAEALAERERIQNELQISLDENTGRWGVKVQGVAVNEIDPPQGVKAAMEREKSAEAIKTADITESEGQRQSQINRAEGERQAAILEAEGERQAVILRAEGEQQAQLLRAQGFSSALDNINQVANSVDAKTMSLQYFETLKDLGESPSTKWIFPMEFTSMLSGFLGMGNSNRQQDGNDGNS